MNKNIISISALLFFIFLNVMAKNDGGPPYNTMAPGEKSCSGGEGANVCHGGGKPDNSGGATLNIDFDSSSNSYIPGQTYTIRSSISQAQFSKFGFQIVSLRNSDNKFVGTVSLQDTLLTRLQRPTWGSYQDRWYVMHRIAGTVPVSANKGEWRYQWKAPATDVGPITFYAGFLAANNNNKSDSGDNTYYTKLVVNPKNIGIKKIENPFDLQVYPNPVNNKLFVTFRAAESNVIHVTLTNLAGEVVYQNSSPHIYIGTENLEISCQHLSIGIYILGLHGLTETTYRRIIIQ